MSSMSNMDFEDIQSLWNSQNDKDHFAINQEALHTTIRQKGKNINRLVQFFEWVMMGINFAVALWLLYAHPITNETGYRLILPIAYLAFAVIALVFRLRRRQEEKHFPHTILGELDKALSQIDYLIRQGYAVTWWYMMPFVLVIGITAWFNTKYWPALVFTVLLIPVSYLGVRWEINKFHLPKKRALEAIRDQLTTLEK